MGADLKSAEAIRAGLILAAEDFDIACRFESNGKSNKDTDRFDWAFALGAKQTLRLTAGEYLAGKSPALNALRQLRANSKGWLFGWLGYDLKNELCQPEKRISSLQSLLPDVLGFPDLFFFEPAHLYICRKGKVEIITGGLTLPDGTLAEPNIPRPEKIHADFSKEEYISAVESIRNHIREGDVYEVNLCQQFYTDIKLNGHDLFRKLNALSKAPFSAWIKDGEHHLACASPERYLSKRGNLLQSQPIKGTAGRGSNSEEDRIMMDQLVNSEKDRAENVMIVDLVRNDFARICTPGSIRVPELFGRHTFEMVHHLISTVEGQLPDSKNSIDALEVSFPMGSMTGAPKVMALELIEKFEKSRRGVYSGAVGYITPEDDMDFNVVIRSALYHAGKQHLRFPVGGAITWDSVAESEYTECLLKAEGLRKLFIV